MNGTIVKLLCITMLFVSPLFEQCTKYAIAKIKTYTDPYYFEQTMGVKTYYLYDIQIQDDSVSFMIGYWSSGITITNYTYEVSDKELKITLYGRLGDPPIDKVLNDFISSFVIPIQQDQYDRISINDDTTKMIIYERE